jgi:four helix bundle protein
MPKTEVFGLISQMQRSAVAIPSNIAEGFGRKGRKEFAQFLYIAYASSLELDTQLIISKRQYPDIQYQNAEGLLTEVQKMLKALIRTVEDNERPSKD